MRSAELEQLIADLRTENRRSSATIHADSKMVVLNEESGERHVFNAEECGLLLGSRDAVERFFEALDYPEEVFIELHDLTVDAEVMTQLESFASTVDEM